MASTAIQVEAGYRAFEPQRYPDHGRAAFFEMVTHDDRTSFYHIARSGGEGGVSPWRQESRSAKYLRRFKFEEGYDWFVTRNGFSSRISRRAGMCRQLNSFLVDIDFHDARSSDLVGCDVLEAAFFLSSCWQAGLIPEPTMMVDTGRGLHLYYALARSTSCKVSGGGDNKAGQQFFKDVYSRLVNLVSERLGALTNAKVDGSVKDFSRVSRVPGTVNHNNGRMCEVIYATGPYHTLKGLSDSMPALARPAKTNCQPGRRFARRSRYTQLPITRVQKIEELQRFRGYRVKSAYKSGRELMCFVYYNAAVQAYPDRDSAFGALESFNSRFVNPLPPEELEIARSSVDKVGFYLMSAQKIAEFLNLTDEEALETGFFASCKETRREAAKKATASKRKARNQKIATLLNKGSLTQCEIADLVGCSVRTIRSVAAELRSRETEADQALTAKIKTGGIILPLPGASRPDGLAASPFLPSPSALLDPGGP